MRLFLSLLLATACTTYGAGQHLTDKQHIEALLNQQVVAWNAGDINQFMEGYWKSDSVEFIGTSIVHGWNATLERYKKTYPSRDAMGVLRFELYSFQFIGKEGCLVTGKYFLTRKNDHPSGMFTLLFRKKNGSWVIVVDHTS
jgi:ketosteroid isomerase-like protein